MRIAVLSVLLCCAAPPVAAQAAASRADSLLQQLVGRWRMTGQVRGRPVVYDLTARRTLGGRYVELHMRDTARAPQYEARVFIGADTLPDRVIVHWLDRFGAAYSIPHGTGGVRGDTLQFEFAYASGPFRDTFVFNRAARTWYFRLESGDPAGGWRLFADYQVRPPRRRQAP